MGKKAKKKTRTLRDFLLVNLVIYIYELKLSNISSTRGSSLSPSCFIVGTLQAFSLLLNFAIQQFMRKIICFKNICLGLITLTLEPYLVVLSLLMPFSVASSRLACLCIGFSGCFPCLSSAVDAMFGDGNGQSS